MPSLESQLKFKGGIIRSRALHTFLSKVPLPRKLFVGPLNGGRFDVELTGLPPKLELKVYLKLYFNFIDSKVAADQVARKFKGADETWFRTTWLDSEKDEWYRRFVEHTERVWNNSGVIFRCTRPNWEEITVTPKIVIERAAGAGQGHFDVDVQKTVVKQAKKYAPIEIGKKKHLGAGYTRVDGRKETWANDEKTLKNVDAIKMEGRAFVSQNYDPNTGQFVATPKVELNQMDVEQRVGNTACSGHLHAIVSENFIAATADFDRNQIIRAIAETGAGVVRFAKHSSTLSPEAMQKLRSFGARMKQLLTNPSTEALIKSIRLELVVATDKNEQASLARTRAAAVAKALAASGVSNEIIVTSTQQHFVWRDRPGHGNVGGQKWVDSVTIGVESLASVEQKYLSKYSYMTVPHEVGHMLGLLDEYSDAKDEMILREMHQQGLISKTDLDTALKGCVQKDDAQRLFAKLLAEFDLVMPAFKIKENYSPDRRSEANYQASTSSLMSAGFNVAPQHFVIVGLALQDITEAYTTWDMEQDVRIPNHTLKKRKFMWRIEKGG